MEERTQEEFVAAVLEATGLTQTELGIELRKPNAYQTVHGWLTGTKRLGYADTMKLLSLAGWLNFQGAPGAVAPADSTSARGPLAELQDGIAQLLLGQAEALERLDRALGNAQPEQKPAAQKSSSTSQRAR